MPAKNIRKKYRSGAIYHLYNRGVNKSNIFNDPNDYKYFINLIDRYLSKTIKIYDISSNRIIESPNKVDLFKYLKIHAYCLMPNHFHILIKQGVKEKSIASFMRRVCGSYAMYFNRKYSRSGVLFQGRYRASLVENMDYYYKILKYITLNYSDTYLYYEWSSHRHFIYGNRYYWLDTNSVVENFGSVEVYKDYIENGPYKGSDPDHTSFKQRFER
jgi:putative transposase